jgi:hypothetical protein
MHAVVGDHVLVRGRNLGTGLRRGEIMEVRGADGNPPYVVRWERDGHEAFFVPGPDTAVEHEAGAG